MRPVRAMSLVGLPVVGLDDGEKAGDIRDVVVSPSEERVTGFTLDAGSLFGDAIRLPLSEVHATGRDAIVLEHGGPRSERDSDDSAAEDGTASIISVDVVTESGRRLGRVSDVVVDADADARVIGFEIDGSDDERLLIRRADAISVSGDALVVAADAQPVEWNELAGFGEGLRRGGAA